VPSSLLIIVVSTAHKITQIIADSRVVVSFLVFQNQYFAYHFITKKI
jgi:hypothetical protein